MRLKSTKNSPVSSYDALRSTVRCIARHAPGTACASEPSPEHHVAAHEPAVAEAKDGCGLHLAVSGLAVPAGADPAALVTDPATRELSGHCVATRAAQDVESNRRGLCCL